MTEKHIDSISEEGEWENSKWAERIEGGVYWLEQLLLAELNDSIDFKELEEWTGWMIRSGYKEPDDIVKDNTQRMLPYVTEEIWQEEWIAIN
jgi:hypothetical protein